MNEQINPSYEFGSFRLVPSERQLLRDGQRVMLPPKAFDTLVVLVQHNGHVVKKDDLLRMVWPDAFVEESNLNHYVSLLRKTLGNGDNGEQYIETVRRYGFRFTADVREVNAEAGALLIRKHTRTHLVLKEEQSEKTSTASTVVDLGESRRPKRGRFIAGLTLALIALIGGTLAARGVYVRKIANEQQAALMVRQHTLNSEAYQEYLAGREEWDKRTSAGLFESIQHFQRAIEKDSHFSLGYAGLADAYAFDLVHWREAEQLADKALEIDSKLAEPHATLGFIRSFWEWKRNDAESEFKLALKLNPNYATAHQWYAIHLEATGRVPEAESEMKRALELEPNSPVMNADMGQILYFDRRYDEAMDACKKALAIDPDFFNAHHCLFSIYQAKGLYDDAVREFFVFHHLSGVSKAPFTEATLAKAYRTQGIRGFWRELVSELEERTGGRYGIAQCYALLGEKDKAFHSLQQAIAKRELSASFTYVDPAFDSLRGDPEFWGLVNQLGLHWPPD